MGWIDMNKASDTREQSTCVKCGHNRVNQHGVCVMIREGIDTDYYKDNPCCMCECEFSKPVSDEASCWHCGVVLAYMPKLRCEDCPDDCDTEGCAELGCSASLPESESSASLRLQRDTLKEAAEATLTALRRMRDTNPMVWDLAVTPELCTAWDKLRAALATRASSSSTSRVWERIDRAARQAATKIERFLDYDKVGMATCADGQTPEQFVATIVLEALRGDKEDAERERNAAIAEAGKVGQLMNAAQESAYKRGYADGRSESVGQFELLDDPDGLYSETKSRIEQRVWDEAIEIVKQNIIYADDIKIGHAAAVIAHTVESRLKSRIVGALENAKARSLAQQEGK